MQKAIPEQNHKFVVEYFTTNQETRVKKLESRWHYDLKKFRNGPVLVEEFNLPSKEKEIKKEKEEKKLKKKKVGKQK
jgi:hypothetical protein